VVHEQLERDRQQDRRQQLVGPRHVSVNFADALGEGDSRTRARYAASRSAVNRGSPCARRGRRALAQPLGETGRVAVLVLGLDTNLTN
jgi:hypothetical protein